MTHCQPFSLPRLSTFAALLVGLTTFELAAEPPAPVAPIITSAATRFTDNRNGTVTDSITGLIWLKDAHCATVSPKAWAAARTAVDALARPSCSLTDGPTTGGQWRLPSRNELESLIDYTTSSNSNPTLPMGHPFMNVQSGGYWSSTTYAADTSGAWVVYLNNGGVGWQYKASDYCVWPVRGGR